MDGSSVTPLKDVEKSIRNPRLAEGRCQLSFLCLSSSPEVIHPGGDGFGGDFAILSGESTRSEMRSTSTQTLNNVLGNARGIHWTFVVYSCGVSDGLISSRTAVQINNPICRGASTSSRRQRTSRLHLRRAMDTRRFGHSSACHHDTCIGPYRNDLEDFGFVAVLSPSERRLCDRR